MDERKDEGLTGSTPAAGQQHGDSSGAGGTTDRPEDSGGKAHHPRPDVPGSRVEDQADQPGVESGRQ